MPQDLKDTARQWNQGLREDARRFLGPRRGRARIEWAVLALIVLVTATLVVSTLGGQLMDQITALFTALP